MSEEKQIEEQQAQEKKAQEQADIIMQIAFPVVMLDIEFCKNSSKTWMEQASRQESMAVLNRRYEPIKTEILREKAKALRLLAEYAESLKEIQNLKNKLAEAEINNEKIDKLFM